MGLIAKDLPADPIGLPEDLIEFLTLGESLPAAHAYSDDFLAIRPFAELTLEPIEIAPCTADFFLPHPDSVTSKAVPKTAINLATISAGEYDAFRLLVWLPEIKRYAIWNSLDHSVRLFGKHMQWRTIVEMPSRLLPGRAEGELHLDPDYATPMTAIRAAQRKTTIASLLGIRRPRFRDFAYQSLALVTLLVFGFMMTTSELPAISPETFDQIEIGMKQHEVMRIIRAWPGWYNEVYSVYGEPRFGGWPRPGWPKTLEKGFARGRTRCVWASRDGKLTVEFDENGAACYVRLTFPSGREPSHPERWPWWQRLLNREAPNGERIVFDGPF